MFSGLKIKMFLLPGRLKSSHQGAKNAMQWNISKQCMVENSKETDLSVMLCSISFI